MIILIGTILLLIVGIILLIIGSKNMFLDSIWIAGMSLTMIFGVILIIEFIALITKPFNYRQFKINYEVVNETITNPDDIRDTDYTKLLIGINSEIKINREFVDNPFIGIFYNRQIAEMELLEKGE